jgi:uncharacterized protein (TIGR02246 family)
MNVSELKTTRCSPAAFGCRYWALAREYTGSAGGEARRQGHKMCRPFATAGSAPRTRILPWPENKWGAPMNQRTLIAVMLATALFATGCEKMKEEKEELEAKVEKAEAPTADLSAEEQAIRNRSAEWMNFANAKDADSIVNGVFTPDAVTVFNKEVRSGSEDIKAGLEKNAKENPESVVSWTTDSVKVAASGDVAVEKGSYYFDPDGAAGKKDGISGKFVTVWEKVDGNWRVISDVAVESKAEKAAT